MSSFDHLPLKNLGGLLKMQIPGSHHRPMYLCLWQWDLCIFNKFPKWFWCTLEFTSHCFVHLKDYHKCSKPALTKVRTAKQRLLKVNWLISLAFWNHILTLLNFWTASQRLEKWKVNIFVVDNFCYQMHIIQHLPTWKFQVHGFTDTGKSRFSLQL